MREPFGHYTLLRRLAVGGMAEIFVAEHAFAAPGDGCVVIKRILPHLSQDPSFVRMFIDEARLAVGLVHPNIVRTVDFGCVGDEHYLTMAFVAGVDLHRLMAGRLQRRQGLGVAASCALGLGLARGLGHTHRFVSADGTAQHVVHRDVSPHNVMVAGTGVPMVMDFGIAKAALRVTHTATDAGTIKGKLSYMAPEQARGEAATQRSDQYSLGVVLWECLAGRRLFADAPQRRLHSVESAEVPPLGQVAPQVPLALQAIVMRALAFHPNQRYGHVDDLCAALAAFVQAQVGPQQAAQEALAGVVRAESLALHPDVGDWSWQQGPQAAGQAGSQETSLPPLGSGGTRVLAAAGAATNQRHVLPLAVVQASNRSVPGRSRHTARRLGAAVRVPHARALAETRRKTPAKRVGPAWRLGRLAVSMRLRLWWALYAAACGAAGNALWPQAWSRLGSAQNVTTVVSACTP